MVLETFFIKLFSSALFPFCKFCSDVIASKFSCLACLPGMNFHGDIRNLIKPSFFQKFLFSAFHVFLMFVLY